jgi:hypothetical protein
MVIKEYQLMDNWCLDQWKELLAIKNSNHDGPFPSNHESFSKNFFKIIMFQQQFGSLHIPKDTELMSLQSWV